MFCQCGSITRRVKDTDSYYCLKCGAILPSKEDALNAQEDFVLTTQILLAKASALAERNAYYDNSMS